MASTPIQHPSSHPPPTTMLVANSNDQGLTCFVFEGILFQSLRMFGSQDGSQGSITKEDSARCVVQRGVTAMKGMRSLTAFPTEETPVIHVMLPICCHRWSLVVLIVFSASAHLVADAVAPADRIEGTTCCCRAAASQRQERGAVKKNDLCACSCKCLAGHSHGGHHLPFARTGR